MTKSKTDPETLTNWQLRNRIESGEGRIYKLKEEMARRERLNRYGTEDPDLRTYSVTLYMTFYCDVKATDEDDAQHLVDTHIEWLNTSAGKQVEVYDFGCSADINEEIEDEDEDEQASITVSGSDR